MNHILSVNTQDYTRKYPYEYCLRIWAKTYYLFDSTGLGLVSNLISKNDSCTKPGLPIGPRRLLLSQPSDLKPTASGTSTRLVLKPSSKTFMKSRGSPGFRHRRTARAQPAAPVVTRAWAASAGAEARRGCARARGRLQRRRPLFPLPESAVPTACSAQLRWGRIRGETS